MSDIPAMSGDRLAKVMARAGLCSRRDAEAWIRAGRVTVNGQKILTPAFNVGDKDNVEVDGAPLTARAGTRLWLYHKPRGLVVTEKDPEDRPTIFAALADKGLPRFLTVGRLDINTEGLLLLTNDGGLKRVLELPATGWLRKYRVRAHGRVTQGELDRLKDGVEVEGVNYGPIEAVLERQQGANVWLEVSLREGKNREVKNVLAPLGLEVNRLIRVSYGPFQLGELPIGGVEAVRSKVLKDQLGARLAREAGVDFDSALPETAPPVRRMGLSGPRPGRFADRNDDRRGPRDGAVHGGGRPGGNFGPRGGRPGGGNIGTRGGFGSRAEGGSVEPRLRRVHFDDGRTETFEEKPRGRPPRGAGGKDAPFGKPRGEGRSGPGRSGDKSFGDKSFGDKAFGDRRPGSRPPRPDGAAPRRFAEAAGGPRPSRRPPRDNDERPEGSTPARNRGPRPGGPRAVGPRPTGARPTGPRAAGPRPAGPRPAGPRPAGARPAGARPAGARPAGPRPGAPPARTGRPGRGAGETASRSPRPASPRPRGKGDGPRRPRGK
jgi:23S rRNA pseudouridine2605 synthase